MRWLTRYVLRGRRYDDLRVSIDEHLEEKVAELIEQGISQQDAERQARREFGNVTLIEERSREIWQWPRLETIWADIRFGLRQLIKAPGFTVTAVLTLSLGIAVNATMFSLVSAFLLARLPGHNPQEIVVLSSVSPTPGDLADANPVSVPNYLAWRADSGTFAKVAASDPFRTASLTGDGQPETISYARVSTDYFDLFGAAPQLGRSFTRGEDQTGRAHLVILSHGLWERRFGSDSSIIGRTVRLDREDYTVIGVMPASFRLLGFTPQLWTPLVLNDSDTTEPARRDRSLLVFARLAPGVSLQRARAELDILAKRANADFPKIERRWGASARTLPDFLVHNFGIRSALAVLMTTVGFILLIACANVAGLLLARATERQKEVAIRVSLGAGRLRIIRQLLTEGIVIALLGGSAGLLLTHFGIGLVGASLTFVEDFSTLPLSLDRNVLLFVLGVSLLSALLSSLAPAFRSARIDVNTGLKSESRTSSAGRSHTHLRTAMVAGEIALTLFLLIGTSLLIRGVYLLDHQRLGFRTDHLLTAGLSLDRAKYNDENRQVLFVRSLTSRLQQISGTEEVAIASVLPATSGGTVPIAIKGERVKTASEERVAIDDVVTPSYFRAFAITVLRGRGLAETDDSRAPRAVLVNQEFVHRYLSGKDPLGVQIKLDIQGAPQTWSQIVGVVSNVKSYSEDTRVDPEVYESFLQRPVPSFAVAIRSDAEPSNAIPVLRRAVAELDAELPLASVMSMHSVIAQQRKGNAFFTHVLAIFGLLALMLAAIGIYGLVAYSVGQRTHEIGIRMAVGAKTSDISTMIVRDGLRTALVGSAIGFIMALPIPKLFDAIFQGVQFGAPVIYPIVLTAILVVSLFAIYIPALRAARVDPKVALRNQ